MRIRVNTTIRGAGICANAGDECDAPDAMAVALIANGAAVEVGAEPAPIEAAVIESPESTMQPRPTPRRGRRAEE